MTEERKEYRTVTPTLAAIDVLLNDGFKITVQVNNGRYKASCLSYDGRSVLGVADTWQMALEQAASEWSVTGGAG